MKLSKSLLGAIMIGITVQITSCAEEAELPQPESEQETQNENGTPDSCPGCGMG